MISSAECKSVVGCLLLVLDIALVYQTACDTAQEVLVGADACYINSIATGDLAASCRGKLVDTRLGAGRESAADTLSNGEADQRTGNRKDGEDELHGWLGR